MNQTWSRISGIMQKIQVYSGVSTAIDVCTAEGHGRLSEGRVWKDFREEELIGAGF